MNIKEADLSYLASPAAPTGLETFGPKSQSSDLPPEPSILLSRFATRRSFLSGILTAASVVPSAVFLNACGGGEEAVASRSGNGEVRGEPIKAELTSLATATSTPTAVVETRPTATATIEAKKECPPMPQQVKTYYDDLIRLNRSGIFKDATTGGPLSEADMRQSFFDPIEKAACFTDQSNKIREDFAKFTGLRGTLSILAAQYYATNRNAQIADVAQKFVSYLENTYPSLVAGSKSAIIPEFVPPHLK